MMYENTKIKIGILSLTERKDIEQFTQRHEKPRVKFCYKKLKFRDLQNFKPPADPWHAVILLHSTKLGRLSLTDVPDARYDKLLKDLEKAYEGKENICVIADDVNIFGEHSREQQLLNLKSAQKSVFEHSENVILCDTLNNLLVPDLKILNAFLGKVYRAVTGDESEQDNAPAKSEPDKDDDEDNQSKVVLVTDASGFIGSHIVQQLTRKGYKVRGALDLDPGTLDRFHKGTLDNEETKAKIQMVKRMSSKLDLFEAGICHYSGWMNAVTGCSYVIHTSHFQDDKPATEDDVTMLLHACHFVGGIEQVVVTGGREEISEDELKNEEWKGVDSALNYAIGKHVSTEAAFKFMGFQIGGTELWYSEWKGMNSALKDAISKYVSEKAARRFMGREREDKPTFGLSIIKFPVVLGPILCEKAEANVELVSRRMEHTPSEYYTRSDICISVCDVRVVAEYHINAMITGIQLHRVAPQCLRLRDMTTLLKSKFKGNWFVSKFSSFEGYLMNWDKMSQCLQDLHGDKRELNQPMDLGTKKTVIDMANSCIERGFIPKMYGYRPIEQGK